MNIEVKSEAETSGCCVACLRQDVELFRENAIVSDTIGTYKRLIGGNEHLLNNITLELCNYCIDALQTVDEFRSTCVSSITFLSQKSRCMKVDECSDTELVADVGSDTEQIKSEEIMLLESLQLKTEANCLEHKAIQNKSGRKCSKLFTLKTAKKVKTKNIKLYSQTDDTPKREASYCSLCCEYFQRNISGHIIEYHATKTPDDQLKCNICEELFKTELQLVAHFDTHREYERPKKCCKCEATFKNRKEYRTHVKTHLAGISKRIYTCEYCNAVYRSSTNLKYHVMRKHQGALSCTQCHKAFFDQDEYEKHIEWEKKKVNERRFFCDHCGYASKWKAALWEHLKKYHVSDKPNYICNECGKSYKTKNQFRSHQINSHLEKTLQCSDCGKKFAYGTQLRKHVRYNHSEKYETEECKICKKKLRAGSLRIHMSAVHQQIRKFPCNECDMTFKTSGSLTKHKYTHSKTRPFNCTLCTTGYYQNEYLRKHYDRVHGIVYTSEDIRKICGKRLLDFYNKQPPIIENQ